MSLAPLLSLLLLLAFVILTILAATKKISWRWPVGIVVAGLILIAIGSGDPDAASMMFGIAGLIVAIATAAIVMSAVKSPLSDFLQETIGERPAKVGTIFAYLIVYFAGLKTGALIFQQGVGGLQEVWIAMLSAVISAPADVIEIIFEQTKAPWLILFGTLMVVGYLIYQRIRGNHNTDSTDVGIEPEGQE